MPVYRLHVVISWVICIEAIIAYLVGCGSDWSAVTSWRGAKQPPVFAAEVGRALVADPEPGRGRVQAIAKHQRSGLLEAEPLLVLDRVERRHCLDVHVERRRTHPHLTGESLDPERLDEVFL